MIVLPMNLTLAQKLQQLRQGLRQGQRPLADWTGDAMAVSAVPGAGKSHSLAVAAAIAITEHQLNAQHQLLIVTYTRSAAAAIRQKVQQQLKTLKQSRLGFTVQTLHGVALQIASRYPAQSGLDLNTQTLISPNQGHRLIKAAVEQWQQQHPNDYRILMESGDFDGETTETLRRQTSLSGDILPALTRAVVSEAKSSGLSPDDIRELSLIAPGSPILATGAGLFAAYERLVAAQNWLDYDDMILAALRVLDDPSCCRQWQQQFFGVFEDEAQDSSPLQERLITGLAHDPATHQNRLVRVGDPNQAINSTFTPADPIYFNQFCQQCATQGQFATMDQAGRSNAAVINAANELIVWVNQDWQRRYGQGVNAMPPPFRLQNIRPVDAGDPQPNPPPTDQGVEIHFPADIFQEAQQIQARLLPLLEANPGHSAAILVRENRQATFLADQLRHLMPADTFPILNVGDGDRAMKIPNEVLQLLQFLDRPHSPDYLRGALIIFQSRRLIKTQDLTPLISQPEQFLYPTPLAPSIPPAAQDARRLCRGLLQARMALPTPQLLPFLGLTLQYDSADLATLHKLAERLKVQTYPQQSLKPLITSLQELLNSEKFEAIAEDNDAQYTRGGQITLITMHKAKGLDWDYVFIPSLHGDVIPGDAWVPNGAKFLGNFTLSEVARAQIRAALHYAYRYHSPLPALPDAPTAWQQAIALKEAEEYRLLYVAMTRAKRLLWLSAAHKAPFRWNQVQARRTLSLQSKLPSPALLALHRARQPNPQKVRLKR